MRSGPGPFKEPSAQTGFPVSLPQNLRGKTDNPLAHSLQSANPAAPAPSPENQSFRRYDRLKLPPRRRTRSLLAPLGSFLASSRPSPTHPLPPALAARVAAQIRAA